MNVVVPIDEIAEILFDNSEELPNDIYVHFMNLLKRYHEYPCESTEKEIRKYLKKIDKPLRIKLERYLPPKPLCVCNCSCYTESRYVFWAMLICGLMAIGALFFAVINNIKNPDIYPPPPKK
jgi:hypothetical protein